DRDSVGVEGRPARDPADRPAAHRRGAPGEVRGVAEELQMKKIIHHGTHGKHGRRKDGKMQQGKKTIFLTLLHYSVFSSSVFSVCSVVKFFSYFVSSSASSAILR